MEEKIKKICERYKIEIKDNLYCLNDIMTNIIMSKDPNGYIRKHYKNDTKKIDKKTYLTKVQFIKVINKGKSYHLENCKKYINNQIDELEEEKTIDDFKKEQFVWLIDGTECWIKAKNIAIFLGYNDTKLAIKMHVTTQNKKQYKDFTKTNIKIEHTKTIEPATLFINEAGLHSLTLKSNKPNAITFKNWICNEVLPSANKITSCNIFKLLKPIKGLVKDIDINKYINKNCFYILHIINKNCFYILHIGDNMYKYGITTKIYDRSSRHNTTFKSDDFIEIYEMPQFSNCRNVENKTRSFLKKRNLNCVYKGQTEIFKPTIYVPLDKILETIKYYIATETNNMNNESEKIIHKPIEFNNNDKQLEINKSVIKLFEDGKINAKQFIMTLNILNNKNNHSSLIENNSIKDIDNKTNQIIQNHDDHQNNNIKGNNENDIIIDDREKKLKQLEI